MTSEAGTAPVQGAERRIKAPPAAIYDAFLDPEALGSWMAPDGASATVEVLEPCEGGRLHMTLTFERAHGKSSSNTDQVRATFLRLRANAEIVLGVTFASDKAEFGGVMVMSWSLASRPDGTLVTIVAENAPPGIDPDEHERGMASTLANLARYIE